MKTIAREIKDRLDVVEREATERYAAYTARRDELREKGIDLVGDKEAFDDLHGLNRAYAEKADEAVELRDRLVKAFEMESAEGPTDRKTPFEQAEGKSIVDQLAALQLGGQALQLGAKFTESAEYKRVVESGILNSKAQIGSIFGAVEVANRDEFKALLTGASTTSAGAMFRADRQPGLYDLLLTPLVIRQLVTVGDTDGDTVEWVKETTYTNAAAETAEATAVAGTSGTKPESALAYAVVQSTVKTIAHWIPATKRALADAGQLRTLIDARLTDGVNRRLDSQMVNGDATGENLRGILNTSGVQTQAIGGLPLVEQILRAITLGRNAFLDPNAILMNPNDFLTMRLAKNVGGDYYYGPPNIAGPMQAWGVPVVLSPVIAAGTSIVGKWDEAILWVREGVTVSASDSHADFFTRNLVAVLAEGRFAFGIPRPAAFTIVS